MIKSLFNKKKRVKKNNKGIAKHLTKLKEKKLEKKKN